MPHWGVIRARGADAAQFIHGQLSQDFVLLGPDQARLAAFCNAKGRMQASFIGIKPDAQTILLVCERSLLAQTLKRLRMFVLRAQCQLDDASEAFALWGLVGASVPAPCASAWQVHSDGTAHTIGLPPGADHARALWLAPADTAPPPSSAAARGHLAMAGGDERGALGVGGGVRAIRSPNAQLRIGGRREL